MGSEIGRRVRDVIADGDVLDRGLESLEHSIVSGPRVINTLSSGTEGRWAGPDGLSLGTNPPVLSQYMLSTWWFHVQNTNIFLTQNILSSFRIH